jgi:hypothetical protein
MLSDHRAGVLKAVQWPGFSVVGQGGGRAGSLWALNVGHVAVASSAMFAGSSAFLPFSASR